MSFVILQQVSSPYALKNAGKTLDHKVHLNVFKERLIASKLEEYESIFKEKSSFIWGSKIGRDHQFIKIMKKHRIENQTLALFRKGSIINRVSVVAMLDFNLDLAEQLWGFDEDGDTWPIVFFMKEIIKISPPIPAAKINAILGNKENDSWQAMRAVVGKEAEQVITYVQSIIGRNQ